MKKYILSFFIIIVFGVYIFYQRNNRAAFSHVNNTTGTTPNKILLPFRFGEEDDDVRVIPPAQKPASSMQMQTTQGSYKDGSYIGKVADAYFGNVQVKTIIKSGRIADVQFLQYPSDRSTSVQINTQAMPYLKSEAIQAQNAKVDIVSGATQTSQAFRESLASALVQAH